jgi:hypothetical protein
VRVLRPTPQPVRRRASRGRRARGRPLEQLALDFAPAPLRWTFSRLVTTSPHRARILERLEFVRQFFPELDRLTIHVGRALKRGVLGWGSMDPERPGIWVRPRRLAYFTIAHELTHLLQARQLVPRGERACDLWALTRSPLIVDCVPGYLRLPRALRRSTPPAPELAIALNRLAREAVARRAAGDRRYLSWFEREVAQVTLPEAPRREQRHLGHAVLRLLGLDS